MIVPELIIIGLSLDPGSASLSFFLEALICNSQYSGRGHYNEGIGFACGDIVFFCFVILYTALRSIGPL